MTFLEYSRSILRYLLEKAIYVGDLNVSISIQYEALAKELELESKNYCQVCCQYLNKKGYICCSHLTEDSCRIGITATGVDFLEMI